LETSDSNRKDVDLFVWSGSMEEDDGISFTVAEIEEAKTKLFANCEKQDGPLPTPCWVWTATTFNTGYGRIQFIGRDWLAHRLSYTVFRGPIPEGLHICHHCDRPLCFNPSHLFTGDDQANVDDAVMKGRHAHGEMMGTAKLTDEKVAAIKYTPTP
jgi:HNH endonuclease